MDLSELQEIIRIFEDSGLSEIELEDEGRRVRLSRHAPAQPYMHFTAPPAQNAAPEQAAAAAPEPAVDSGAMTIDSPMVGTFYAASAPGEAPFVLPGDSVAPDQTICIIEAMKIMNEVAAKTAGVIEKVLVENGDPVEFGQPLFTIRPLA